MTTIKLGNISICYPPKKKKPKNVIIIQPTTIKNTTVFKSLTIYKGGSIELQVSGLYIQERYITLNRWPPIHLKIWQEIKDALPFLFEEL